MTEISFLRGRRFRYDQFNQKLYSDNCGNERALDAITKYSLKSLQ